MNALLTDIFVQCPFVQDFFEGAIITDGKSSFSIFAYHCGYLSETNGNVGFNAAGEIFENYFYSSVTDLTCRGADDSGYVNIIYTLGLTGIQTLIPEYAKLSESTRLYIMQYST